MDKERRIGKFDRRDRKGVLFKMHESIICLKQSFEKKEMEWSSAIDVLRSQHNTFNKKLDENTCVTVGVAHDLAFIREMIVKGKWFWGLLEKFGNFMLWAVKRWVIILTAITVTYAALKIMTSENLNELIRKLFH